MTIPTKPGRRFLSKYRFPTYIPKGAGGGSVTPGYTKALSWVSRNWTTPKGFTWAYKGSRKGQWVFELTPITNPESIAA